MITAQLKGMQRLLTILNTFNKKSKGKVAKILQEYGNKMVEEARKNHRFQTRSGNLERSISMRVDAKNSTLSFYLDDTFLMSGGYNYGWIQHDGSGTGYKQSKMFPKVTPKLQTGGITHDHFMMRAWDKYQKEMEQAVTKALLEFWR